MSTQSDDLKIVSEHYSEYYKALVEKGGFTNVSITQLAQQDFPDAVVNEMARVVGMVLDIKKRVTMKGTYPYFKVKTDQGEFGIIRFFPDFIDLTSSGMDVMGAKLIPLNIGGTLSIVRHEMKDRQENTD